MDPAQIVRGGSIGSRPGARSTLVVAGETGFDLNVPVGCPGFMGKVEQGWLAHTTMGAGDVKASWTMAAFTPVGARQRAGIKQIPMS
jgi:hypothetical protein